MKGNLVDFIPAGMQIEIEDIGHLFWRYCCQSQTATPHHAAREWIGRMNDVCNEEWGEDLKLSVDLMTIPTCDLVNELAKREGVQEFVVRSRDEVIASSISHPCEYGRDIPESVFYGIFGPPRILVVKD